MDRTEEEQTIRRCRDGELEAYKMVYERYEQPLLRTAVYAFYLGAEDNRPAAEAGKGTIPVRLETSSDITIKKEL
jgi:hypothetical protein